jgi:hypothetical protein
MIGWNERMGELGGIEGRVGFEHAMDAEQEFSHGGDDGDHLGLVALIDEVAVALGDDGFVLDGDQGRHVESGAQIAIARFGDVAMAIEAGAGLTGPGVETGLGDPLRSLHGGIEDEEFAENADGTLVGEAGERGDQLVFALQRRLACDQLTGGRFEFFDPMVDLAQCQAEIGGDDPGARSEGLESVEAVGFAGALGVEVVEAPADGLQGEASRSGCGPAAEGHLLEIVQDAAGIDLVGFAPGALGAQEVFDRFGIDDADLEARGAAEHQSQFEAVGAGGLEGHPHDRRSRRPTTGLGNQPAMAGGIIGQAQGLDLLIGSHRDHQFFASNIDADRQEVCFHGWDGSRFPPGSLTSRICSHHPCHPGSRTGPGLVHSAVCSNRGGEPL